MTALFACSDRPRLDEGLYVSRLAAADPCDGLDLVPVGEAVEVEAGPRYEAADIPFASGLWDVVVDGLPAPLGTPVYRTFHERDDEWTSDGLVYEPSGECGVDWRWEATLTLTARDAFDIRLSYEAEAVPPCAPMRCVREETWTAELR